MQTIQFESIYTVYMEETEMQTQRDGRCWESSPHKTQSWIILATSREGLTSLVLWNEIQTTCPTNEPIVACSEGYIVSISFDTSDVYTVSLNTSISFCTLVNFDTSDIKWVHTTYMYFLTFDTSDMHIIEQLSSIHNTFDTSDMYNITDCILI